MPLIKTSRRRVIESYKPSIGNYSAGTTESCHTHKGGADHSRNLSINSKALSCRMRQKLAGHLYETEGTSSKTQDTSGTFGGLVFKLALVEE